jgi:hypothetical protein
MTFSPLSPHFFLLYPLSDLFMGFLDVLMHSWSHVLFRAWCRDGEPESAQGHHPRQEDVVLCHG